jgi:EmrB/QacA subfamily drug resistance transporter
VEHPTLTHPAAPVSAPDTAPYARRWWALIPLSLGILISAVDATIVNVALPSIADDLNATNADLQWILDSYIVVLAGLILLGGGLADRYGRPQVFVAGFTLFGIGSLLATFAGSPSVLIAARAVTGVGGALMLPPALSLMAVIFTDLSERARAVAIYAGISGVGIAAGPVVGGILLDRFWWGSVFLVNVPICVVAVLLTIWLVPVSRKPGGARLDVVGAVLSVLSLGALVYGIIEGPTEGWFALEIVAALGLGILFLLAFMLWELRTPAPMFDVRVLRIPAVAGAATGIFVVYITFYGLLYLVPQYLQYVRGFSTLAVGLGLLPFGALFALLSPQSARVAARFGVGPTIVGGLLLMTAGLLLLAFTRWFSGYAIVAAGEVVYALGWASLMAPATTAVMNAVPVEKAGDGSAVNQVSRQVGGAFGVAVIGSVFASAYVSQLGTVRGVSASKAATADRSLGEALGVAAKLQPGPSGRLVSQATDAFEVAAQIGFLVAAVLALAGAAVAWWTLVRAK